MHLQQEAQRDMMERIREQQERERLAAKEARRAAKFPKPLLQKFSEKDDMESYLVCLSMLPLKERRHGLHSSQDFFLEMPWIVTPR